VTAEADARAAEGAATEYAAAREAAAVVDVPGRGLLAVTGPQRIKFLHNILSHDLQSRRPGQGTLAAIMDVKGRLLVLLRALVTDDAVLLEMPADRLDVVEPLLMHYKVAAPVRFARRPLAALGLLGPAAVETLRAAGIVLPADVGREDHVAGTMGAAALRVVRASDLPAGGWLVHVAPEDLAATRQALAAAGARPAGPDVLDVLRIEDGRPWYGRDVSEDNLLHETGLVGEYHSPSKGCYVGQEVIARLEARGAHVNKTLRGLRLQAPVERGAAVRADGKDVGVVTTSGVSPRLGPIAMAFVHRSRAEAGTAVEVAGTPATVATLPLAG
jgi:tRNA-modifying protein YgfZ